MKNLSRVKPPWIPWDMFCKMPFNFCDRWCERCEFTSICRVFQKEKSDKAKVIAQGKNPNSPEVAFEIVADNLHEALSLLKKELEQLGITEEELAKTKVVEFPDGEDLPTCKMVEKFATKVDKYLQEILLLYGEAPDDAETENWLEIVDYYHTLVGAKTYRAETSAVFEAENKDDTTFDSKTSAFIVINALFAMSESLLGLAKKPTLSPAKRKSLELSRLALSLADFLNSKFGLEMQL